MKETISIAIVGMGPRGLTVLERLVEHAPLIAEGVELAITVFDTGECGQGVHRAQQPDHLLINTVASQVTMFAPVGVMHDSGARSLVQWAHEAGYRFVGGRFIKADGLTGRAINTADHLPRSLLGEYLSWVYRKVVAALPHNVTITHRRATAIDLAPVPNGYEVRVQGGAPTFAHYAILTTGHGNRKPTQSDAQFAEFVRRHRTHNADLNYFSSPYPIENLDSIAPTATIAVQGFGLTAHDVVSALTLGRGGRFVERDGALAYVRSGLEPTLLLVSRNCLPFAARGINQKGLTGRHEARFFTPSAVADVRAATFARTGDYRIDFRADVLPLIIKEMAYAYRLASTDGLIAPETFKPTQDELEAIRRILWPLEGQSFASFDAFRGFFLELVRDDLCHALLGNVTSPVKAATDVLRDTREALRSAVEFGGLTPDSHRYFVDEFNAITNRVSFGPPLRRNQEWLALHAAGVLDLGGGPGAKVTADESTGHFCIATQFGERTERRYADVLIAARLDPYSPVSDGSPLSAALLDRGLVRPYRNGDYHPGGIDIDPGLHPLDRKGEAQPRLWAIGFPVEGAHFYTHALPRPGIASRQTRDADVCVRALLESIAAHAASTARADTDTDADRDMATAFEGDPA
ncbi:FAD/NAD(P)-binding protein [Trinickia diaoshuihuensis]|uniref:FAD/NAD(P)-binding protein n=1 Tax=Trinickia diaoshuihuensis TaxID=2292265 RepID=UPI000E22B2EA|nr:FAD/NAD(P)-binding protein [Trinickia diaoshuihuensis]